MRIPGPADVPPPPPGVETFAKTARRLEYKHLVPISRLGELRASLLPWVELDRYSRGRPGDQYTVRSIYYDSRRLACYEEKVEGFRTKKKLRIRGYNDPDPDGTVFLEIKRKNEDYIDKSRAPLRWGRIPDVFAGYGPALARLPFAPGSPEEVAARRFLYNYYRRRMMPAVLVTYEREAYYSRFDPTLRITFDKNVRSRLYPRLGSLYEDRGSQFVTPGHFVFEVKFHRGLPRWLGTVLTRFDIRRQAFSKFALGIDCQRVENKTWRGVAHTVEFPEAPGPLERRRVEKWVDGVLLAAASGPAPDEREDDL